MCKARWEVRQSLSPGQSGRASRSKVWEESCKAGKGTLLPFCSAPYPGWEPLTFPSSLLTTHGLLVLLTQNQFGRTGSRCPGEFCLFQSKTKNLLFNDNTECLAKLHGKTTYDKYLGQEYVVATANLKQCSSSREWILDGITEEATWQNVAGFLLGSQTAPKSWHGDFLLDTNVRP